MPKDLVPFLWGVIASLSFIALACLAEGCTTNVLGPTDTASLKAVTSIEAQEYRDLDPDSGVSREAVRSSVRAVYCRTADVLGHSSVAVTDGGIACSRSSP